MFVVKGAAARRGMNIYRSGNVSATCCIAFIMGYDLKGLYSQLHSKKLKAELEMTDYQLITQSIFRSIMMTVND